MYPFKKGVNGATLISDTMFDKYKNHFLETYKNSAIRFGCFPNHVYVVVEWAERLCNLYPEADREAVLIGAWFHDIGHFVGNEVDHAVSSEKEARLFLEKEGYPEDKMNKILHVVRSHRNSDVKPETLEAKIVCCADSASHLTSDVYFGILSDDAENREYILGKIERDFRDLAAFPEIEKELTPIYKAWKELMNTFPTDFAKFLSRDK